MTTNETRISKIVTSAVADALNPLAKDSSFEFLTEEEKQINVICLATILAYIRATKQTNTFDSE